MTSNINLLKYSVSHPEDLLDANYMFVKKHADLNLYASKTKEIKKLLIAISKIIDKKTAVHVVNDLFHELAGELKQYANCSEFGCFINACDSRIETVADDLSVLKRITKIYFANRDLNEIVPEEWVQAIIDKGASRKKGKAGELKLIKILENARYVLIERLAEFDNHQQAVCVFSSNKSVNRFFKTNFGKSTQNKKLDLIVKDSQQIYFLEAKHVNTGGGAQNKQILELINVIRSRPLKENYHYVAFLDGVYFNAIFGDGEAKKFFSKKNKFASQKEDIIKALAKNSNNYFVNTAGFKKLFIE